MERWSQEYMEAALKGDGDLQLMIYHKALLYKVAGKEGLYKAYWTHFKQTLDMRRTRGSQMPNIIRPGNIKLISRD